MGGGQRTIKPAREVALSEAATCHQTHSHHISPSYVCAKFSQTWFEVCMLQPFLNHHLLNHHLEAPDIVHHRPGFGKDLVVGRTAQPANLWDIRFARLLTRATCILLAGVA